MAVSRKLSASVRDYIGASITRPSLKQYTPGQSDADSRTLSTRQSIVDRARDLTRNVPIVAGAVDTKTTHVIGPGLRFQSRVDSAALAIDHEVAAEYGRRLEREWEAWSDSTACDLERSSTFGELQTIVLQARMTDGDIFVLTPSIVRSGSPYGIKLQLIESDRCTNPRGVRESSRFKGGIEKDENGAPLRYHFAAHHPGDHLRRLAADRWVAVDAYGSNTGRRNVLHIMNKRRSGQTRGVPDLGPVIELCKQLGSYTEAEIAAAVNAAAYTIFVTSEDGFENDAGDSTDLDEVWTDAARMTFLRNGESIESPTPGRPNQQFEAFVLALMSQLGSALGVPFELMMKRFNSSFSASQAAMLEMYRYVITERRRLVSQLCAPVLELFVDEAVALGRLDLPGYMNGDPVVRRAYLSGAWIGPPKNHIREDISIKAAAERVKLRISTRAREAMELTGEDYDSQVFPQIVREEDALKRAGLEPGPVSDASAETGDDIDEEASA